MTSILHIPNAYCGSTVYQSLVEALDGLGLRQQIYALARSHDLVGKNAPTLNLPNSSIHYSTEWKLIYRMLFHYKVRAIRKDIEQAIDLKSVNIIHAHTLYSDGAVAHSLYKRHGIPYVVAVRNTDINVYARYMPHTWRDGVKVIEDCQRLIFITPNYIRRLQAKYPKLATQIESKSLIIPNGLASFWFEHAHAKSPLPHTPFRFLYVGRFLALRNLVKVIKAIDTLNARGIPCQLTLIGGGGDCHEKIVNLAAERPNRVTYLGWVSSPEALRTHYRDHDAFVMPSTRETFGLVYLEALTQGLPILYSQQEGIDGVVPPECGIACDPHSLASVIESMQKLIESYEAYSISLSYLRDNFNWEQIAKRYVREVYSCIQR